MKEKITIDTLSRAVPEVTTVRKDIQELGIEAMGVLGYKVLVDATFRNPLARALEKLEMEVLDNEEVDLYKKLILSDPERKKDAMEYDDDEEEDDDDEEDGITFRWGKTKIERYSKPIPEFVLMKAIQLKREVPMVEFFVEDIKQLKDPFLIAVLGDEKYYIEVWNEPKFEGRLTKGR